MFFFTIFGIQGPPANPPCTAFCTILVVDRQDQQDHVVWQSVRKYSTTSRATHHFLQETPGSTQRSLLFGFICLFLLYLFLFDQNIMG